MYWNLLLECKKISHEKRNIKLWNKHQKGTKNSNFLPSRKFSKGNYVKIRFLIGNDQNPFLHLK